MTTEDHNGHGTDYGRVQVGNPVIFKIKPSPSERMGE